MILPLALATGCSTRKETVTPAGQLESAGTPRIIAEGTFQPTGPDAVTYDPAVVPAGATAQVAFGVSASGVRVRLGVTGMKPARAYGAHLHTKPCTPLADAAGPHYQHSTAPKASASPPSVDPSYANPQNEVWLDFDTDSNGAASVMSAQTWTFDDTHPPRSLIVHAETTRTADGEAGTAGPRAACLTLPAE